MARQGWRPVVVCSDRGGYVGDLVPEGKAVLHLGAVVGCGDQMAS